MKHIPGGKEVEQSIKATLKNVKIAIKEIKDHASKMLAKGDYEGAEKLIPKAQEVEAFKGDVEVLSKRWREIERGPYEADRRKKKSIPLWKYYVPTLRALIELGGTAKVDLIEGKAEHFFSEIFVNEDPNSSGLPSELKRMVKRALRSMEKEGFVRRDNKEWHITPSGRKAAEVKLKEVT